MMTKENYLQVDQKFRSPKLISNQFRYVDNAIKSVTTTRNLGIWIDESPSMAYQIQKVSKPTSIFVISLEYATFEVLALARIRS